MKKILIVILSLSLVVLCLAGCNNNATTQTNAPVQTDATETTNSNPSTPVDTVMTYSQYVKAALDTKVTIESYVQAKQSWWDNKGTFYLVGEDGAYFVYNMACSQEEYDKLTPGTKVRITGTKSEWSGEVEIIDATYTILEGSYIATPVDVTDKLFNTDALYEHINQLVSFKGLTVGEKKDANGNSCAFLYKWNGSGEKGDDLYFDVILEGQTYTFTVESYLCDENSDVYKAVEALQVGDKIDCEGFLYWYNGINTHTTKVTKSDDPTLTHEQYVNAALESPVVIESYVQGKQSWWDNKATLYLESRDGAYFVYNVACTQEDYAKLTLGQKIRVTGVKSEWSGEVEVIDGTFELVEGSRYISSGIDVTEYLGTEELIQYQNRFVLFKGLTVAARKDADGNPCAFQYKWNGSGDRGDDLYFDVEYDGTTYTFTVESYLCDENSDVYKAVEKLNVGDKIDLEGFLYWYNGVNPHITTCVVL